MECEYVYRVTTTGPLLHRVTWGDGYEDAHVRTVKQLPVTEPTAFGTRGQDARAVRAVRVVEGPSVAPCWATDGGGLLHWRELTPPIDVDPDWGDK